MSEFFWWQGASGFWHIHTVIPLERHTYFESANYAFVRRDFDLRRTPLYFGQSANLRDRLPWHEKLDSALALGANELHVHLLADTDARRFAVETDLRNGHRSILNDQPSFADLLFQPGTRARF